MNMVDALTEQVILDLGQKELESYKAGWRLQGYIALLNFIDMKNNHVLYQVTLIKKGG